MFEYQTAASDIMGAEERMKSDKIQTNRRRFLGLLAAGGGCGIGAGTLEAYQAPSGQRPLADADRFDTGGRNGEIAERAASLARDHLAKSGNCAQATIAALQEAIDFVPVSDDVYRAGSCLHGGATATGNANCGGFTGAGIVIGHLCGRSRANMSDREATRLSGQLLRQVATKYEEAYGCVVCKDVREKAGKQCGDVVENASRWAAEAILAQFSQG